MSFIGRSWHGQEKLWKVYWLYHVLGTILFIAALTILTVILMFLGTKIGAPFSLFACFFFGSFILWEIWIEVSLWRCAFNANGAFWGYLVRVLVVLFVIGAVGQIAGGRGNVDEGVMEQMKSLEQKISGNYQGMCAKFPMQYDIARKQGDQEKMFEIARFSDKNCSNLPKFDVARDTAPVPAPVAAPAPAPVTIMPVQISPARHAECERMISSPDPVRRANMIKSCESM